MQAGKYYLLHTTSKKRFNIKEWSFSNMIDTVSGVFQLVLSFFSQKDLIETNNIMLRDIDLQVLFGNDKASFVIIKGILSQKTIDISESEYAMHITITHKTHKLNYIQVSPFENFNQGNANKTILNLMLKTRCNLLYDKITLPIRGNTKLEGNKISGESEPFIDILDRIVNDLNAKYFTTTINNFTIFNIYDNAKFLDTKEQDITNENLIEAKLMINYNNFIDNANISSEQGISSPIDLRQVGETAIWTKASTTNKGNNNSIPIGLKKIQNKRLDLPAVVFNKTISTTSNTIDIVEYSNMLIREKLNDAVLIEVKVNSMFINIKNPQYGIWQLGSKINIFNDLLIDNLKTELPLYITINSRYYFILKAIQTNGNEVKLSIGLSELLRKS